jgi:hypothetical protein
MTHIDGRVPVFATINFNELFAHSPNSHAGIADIGSLPVDWPIERRLLTVMPIYLEVDCFPFKINEAYRGLLNQA